MSEWLCIRNWSLLIKKRKKKLISRKIKNQDPLWDCDCVEQQWRFQQHSMKDSNKWTVHEFNVSPFSRFTSISTLHFLLFHQSNTNSFLLWSKHPNINFQAEKELQAHKSRILASKLANIRAMEQKCWLFDRKIASHNFNLLSLKSQIENLEAKYDSLWQEFRYIIIIAT
jgi:hypothetical protein